MIRVVVDDTRINIKTTINRIKVAASGSRVTVKPSSQTRISVDSTVQRVKASTYGPQGPTGATGPEGPTGATGPQGPMGSIENLPVNPGGILYTDDTQVQNTGPGKPSEVLTYPNTGVKPVWRAIVDVISYTFFGGV